jgi:hypothetical protein
MKNSLSQKQATLIAVLREATEKLGRPPAFDEIHLYSTYRFADFYDTFPGIEYQDPNTGHHLEHPAWENFLKSNGFEIRDDWFNKRIHDEALRRKRTIGKFMLEELKQLCMDRKFPPTVKTFEKYIATKSSKLDKLCENICRLVIDSPFVFNQGQVNLAVNAFYDVTRTGYEFLIGWCKHYSSDRIPQLTTILDTALKQWKSEITGTQSGGLLLDSVPSYREMRDLFQLFLDNTSASHHAPPFRTNESVKWIGKDELNEYYPQHAKVAEKLFDMCKSYGFKHGHYRNLPDLISFLERIACTEKEPALRKGYYPTVHLIIPYFQSWSNMLQLAGVKYSPRSGDRYAQKCFNIITEILGTSGEYERSFDWLGSLRLDLYIDEHNFAIEFDDPKHFHKNSYLELREKEKVIRDYMDREIGPEDDIKIPRDAKHLRFTSVEGILPVRLYVPFDVIKNVELPKHGIKLLRIRYDEPLTVEHLRSRIEQCLNDDPSNDLNHFLNHIISPVVGLKFYKGTCEKGDKVILSREPNNPYDRFAIRIDNTNNVPIGHLPKELVADLALRIDNGEDFEGTVIYAKGNKIEVAISKSFYGS